MFSTECVLCKRPQVKSGVVATMIGDFEGFESETGLARVSFWRIGIYVECRLSSQSVSLEWPSGPSQPTQLVAAASRAINGLAILVAMLILAEGGSWNRAGAKSRWVGLG